MKGSYEKFLLERITSPLSRVMTAYASSLSVLPPFTLMLDPMTPVGPLTTYIWQIMTNLSDKDNNTDSRASGTVASCSCRFVQVQS